MIFTNPYQKVVLTFMLMIRVFFIKTKASTKIADGLTKKILSTLQNGSLIIRCQFIAGKNNTKYILFSKTKRSSKLSITYGNHKIKPVPYCRIFGGVTLILMVSLAIMVFEKMSMQKLKFLYKQNKYLITKLKRLIWNVFNSIKF